MEENHYNTYFYKSRPLTELGLEFRNLLFWNAPFWVLQIICIHFMLITCVWKRKCKYTFFDVYMYACVQHSAPPFHYLGLDTVFAVTSMDYSYFFLAREQQWQESQLCQQLPLYKEIRFAFWWSSKRSTYVSPNSIILWCYVVNKTYNFFLSLGISAPTCSFVFIPICESSFLFLPHSAPSILFFTIQILHSTHNHIKFTFTCDIWHLQSRCRIPYINHSSIWLRKSWLVKKAEF